MLCLKVHFRCTMNIMKTYFFFKMKESDPFVFPEHSSAVPDTRSLKASDRSVCNAPSEMSVRHFHRLLRTATPRLPRFSRLPHPSATPNHYPFCFSSSSTLLRALIATTAASALVVSQADSPSLPSSILDPDTIPLSLLSTTEEQTGVQFPLSLADGARLHGTGVRYMGGIVRVYALGFYADEASLKKVLSDWSGFGRDDILHADLLWNKLCESSELKRTIRMVVVREVTGVHMQKGFERGLMGRVVKRSRRGKCKPAECKRAVGLFGSLFGGVGVMKVGSEVVMEIGDGRIGVWIDGRWMGEVRNGILEWAVGDLFLGERGVTPTLRESVAEGLERVLRQ